MTDQQVFTVTEIAAEWKFSVDTIQRLFVGEPDVFIKRRNNAGKRSKKTLRIPAAVKERVWRRSTNKHAVN
ncbi:MAG: hypothetical protein ABSG03_27705 [Bryobacteraceae bacterium]|jgi:hypothetical protein